MVLLFGVSQDLLGPGLVESNPMHSPYHANGNPLQLQEGTPLDLAYNNSEEKAHHAEFMAKTFEGHTQTKLEEIKDPQVILIQSEGEAAEWVGGTMGFFDLQPDRLNSRPVYGQRGGDQFLYYTRGSWLFSNEVISDSYNEQLKTDMYGMVWYNVGVNDGWLSVLSEAILPPISSSSTPWQYVKDGAWAEDPTLELVYDPVEDDSCSSVTVSSSGPAERAKPDHMGTYRWTGEWQTGRKVFYNGEVFLRVITGRTQWGIGREKNSWGSGIAGGRGTTCPCSLHAGPTVRFKMKGWAYASGGEWNDEDASLIVEC